MKRHGFTIVELLIVIVVIAILASISVVAYNGIQNRANDVAIQADLNNIAKKVFEVSTETGQVSIPTAAMNLHVSKSAYNITSNNLYFCRNTTTNEFAISAYSKSGIQWKYVNGTVSQHGSRLYAVQTCDLILGTWDGAGLGYNYNSGTNPTWANWAG